MPSPTEQFVCLPELIRCVAKASHNRGLLHSCCLVNKAFNDAFTPSLYSEIWFRSENAHFLIDFPVLANNAALRYTEILDISIPAQHGQNTKYSNGVLCELYNSGVASLLAKMPRLTRFRLDGIVLFSSTLADLQEKCPMIQTLIVHHRDDIEDIIRLTDYHDFHNGYYEWRDLILTHNFSHFANLTSLQISGLHGDLVRARKDIVQTLLKSPNLHSLGLSINEATVESLSTMLNPRYTDFQYFLISLIKDFVDAGGTPLRLRKLILGFSIMLWVPGTYFSGLTDLACLEEVYITNQEFHGAIEFIEDNDHIAWSLFTPVNCPNLNTIGIYEFNDNVRKWAQSIPPGYIRRLSTSSATAEDLNTVMGTERATRRKLTDGPRTLTINIEDMSSLASDFTAVDLRGIQALSIVTRYRTQDVESEIISWITAAPDLEQFYLSTEQYTIPKKVGTDGTSPEDGSLEHRIVYECKKLRYLRVQNNAWRVLRLPDGGVGFERLDRFESRDIEMFQPRHLLGGY
ncbi:RNI-like protein [Glarea lozoyensis ATCC 20868]|uniref:RNI-like protein n=1 Tax=Glarea lozoyensis (strain ATCC 20868 / MF5171) TaxID=1116229 RepID=S3DX29_GLAL2|nr:RNI-like protein [Glarea lozoyensis ATCC 20868]EPE36521.1 RNI-like protein [Glarea lozoyensis ATCC 20868]